MARLKCAKRRNRLPHGIETVANPEMLCQGIGDVHPDRGSSREGLGLISGSGVNVIIGLKQAPEEQYHHKRSGSEGDLRLPGQRPILYQQDCRTDSKCDNSALAEA